MTNLSMFCVTLEPNHKKFIDELGYIPVGVGEKNFNDLKGCLTDNSGNNISEKNKNYGEYTFHYWLWKNYIDSPELQDGWFGFCQYRKFWSTNNKNLLPKTIDDLKPLTLKSIPESYKNFDVILGDPYYINQFKPMKFFKKGFKIILENPSLLFKKEKRNLKFHFDLMHGNKNLEKAIELLDDNNKKDFTDYVNSQVYFNPHNMFICKSKKLLKEYYSNLFPWLKKCESLFGFKELRGFGKIRIYTFLAERFMPYWFQKNAKVKTMPIIFYDIRKNFN